MVISIAGTKHFCPYCNRSTWMHRRAGKLVCRGDVPPSVMHNFDALAERGVFTGCGIERDLNRAKYGSNSR